MEDLREVLRVSCGVCFMQVRWVAGRAGTD